MHTTAVGRKMLLVMDISRKAFNASVVLSSMKSTQYHACGYVILMHFLCMMPLQECNLARLSKCISLI
jgi:hypothetical protein